ncbi:hypothetical protein QBC46DRAFT_462585 [Diplogelasinospora grovesii]|uniref:Uncharacterized protein n=1 Tax=Diplogelasinospora grovesii TaxID=303347 RepID=A0AAN6MWZ8_9PEZI|nr:hypothetical protein QBC46DRAFT_462585 [Diplogelasinospora grovesii]
MTLEVEKQPPRPLSLVRLPPHLRHRIYLHTGVARFDGRPYTYYLDGRKESHSMVTDRDPPPPGSLASLLLSCSQGWHGIVTTALLYSANRFVIFYSHQGSLEPLRALSPTSLASLTSLKIVLNESSCHQPTDSADYPPHCCCANREDERWCAKYHGSQHRRPLLDPALGLDLTSAKLAAQAMLSEWHDTAAYLSSRVSVGRLELSLEVTWSRQDRGYQVCRPPCSLQHEVECPPHVHNGCQLSQCHSKDTYPDPDSAPSPGCFCRRRHAAFSFTCNCWAPPTDLFLICRALFRDAQFVFFSGNRFIVHDFHAMLPSDLPAVQLEPWIPSTASTGRYYPYERFAASEFLRDIVPTHCLADLRFLELVFPPYVPHGWPHNEHAAVLDWRATVDWIRGKINPPALTIRLVMADFVVALGPIIGRDVLTENQGTEILKGCTRIIHPLKHLVRDDGLAGFYMQVAYPSRWTRNTFRHIQQYGEQWVAEVEQNLKERGERYVRGQDASLDSRNKAEPRKSVWQRWYEMERDC